MKVMLLVGSCRPPRSNTASLATFLAGELERLGCAVCSMNTAAWRDGDSTLSEQALEDLGGCDAVVFVAPVYLDTMPAPAMRMLVSIRDWSLTVPGFRPSFYAVAHSGYVESAHRVPLLDASESFCRSVGWDWKGGIGFGGSSPIAGAPLESLGFMTRHLRRGLAHLAEGIAQGMPVPLSALEFAARSPLPLPVPWFAWVMNRVNARHFRKQGLTEPFARPYDDGSV